MSLRNHLILVLSLALVSLSVTPVKASSITELQATPVTVLSSDAGSIRLGFDSQQIQPRNVEKDGNKFELFQIPDEGMTFDYGQPLLPAISRFVLVPADAGLEFSYKYDEPRRLRSTTPPAICDDSVMIGSAIEPLISLYPGKIAEMSDPFVVRGARLVKVTVFPIQYDPVSGSYLCYDNIETSITYTSDDPVNPVRVPVRRHRSKLFKELIGALAINGGELGRDDPPDSEPPHVGHYLIVAHQATLGYQVVRDWIEFRRRTGYKMEILVAQNPGDPDNTKAAIQARYNGYLERGEDPFDYIALIGDVNYDQPAGHAAENVLQTWQLYSIWGGFPHSDFLFACLEGGQNDLHPDVGYSRFPAGSEEAAKLIFGRTLCYEEKPRMANPEWFRRGAVYSQHWGNGEFTAWHIGIHTNVRYGEEVLKSLGFNDIFFYENVTYDQPGSEIGPRIAAQYNRGVNVMIGRAEIYYWQGQFQGVNGVNENNTDHVYPLDICYSGHGEWANQNVFRSGTWPNDVKGPVARTCGWGWPASAPMSYIWLSMVNGVLQRDLPIGIARALSVISIEGVFPNFNIPNVNGQLYSHIKTDTDMYGDPGLQPWTGVPKLPEINMPETIPPSTKSLEVFVHGYRSDEPMPGAQVTLYAPGNTPPLNQPAQYGAFTAFLQKTTTADADGIARFVLEGDESFIANRPLCITASGRDIRPFTDTVRVAAVQAAIELGEYTLTELGGGNGDGVVNPGETFDLAITARNVGTAGDLENVMVEAISVSSNLEVLENQVIEFGNIDHGGTAEGRASIVIYFAAETPDGSSRPITRPTLKLHFTSGDASWDSQIKFMPEAPNFELHAFVGSNIIGDEVQALNLDIGNVGAADAERISVELRSLGMGVTVVENSVMLDALNAGDHHRLESPFSISGNRIVVPGSKNQMVAIFRSDNGFVDSAYFEVQVLRERANAPTGPDKYGYICFDDTDRDWDMAPQYDWVEINGGQDAQFDGVRLRDLEGNTTNDIGKCLVVDLGFRTQFYGIEYSQITIATNGFISMGAQPRITNYANWRMDEAKGAGVGMLAPYWDDVRFGQTGAIWGYHDADNGRYIVEWERMHPASGDAEWTFQVIILDKDVWITESGDPNIIFQYKSISSIPNIRDGDVEWSNNIPFASVGISSPSGTTGINYSFLNVRPTSAAPLQNRRVLLFSTSPRYKACTLRGFVRDARTSEPIEGARVFTEHGFVDDTDADGYWQIIDALAEVPFDITAYMQGYNDSTYKDQEVAEGDTIQYDFDLLHPEFSPSTMLLSDRLDPDRARDLHWNIYNGGNGPLYWSAEKRLLGDADAEPWELRRRYNVGQITDDDRIEGVIFAQDKFFLAGANGIDSANLIYVLDRDGELLSRFEQIGSSRYGYKDMDWDGNYLWAAGEDSIYCLTTDGQVVTSWPDPLSPSQYIAYNSEEGILYLCGTTTQNIVRCDLEGHVLEGALSRRSLRMYGLGYWPEDPDGYDLYIVNHPSGTPTNITKMNVATGDTMFVFEIPQDSSSSGQQSAWITNEFDVYSWVFMSIQNVSAPGGGDRVEIHQLDARKDWMNLDIWADTLDAFGTQDLILSFNSDALPDTLFEGELIFRHNADDGETIIGIMLDVIGPERPERFDLVKPTDGDTIIALPLHGDTLRLPPIDFSWNPIFDWNFADSSTTYIFNIGAGGEFFQAVLEDTTISLVLDTLDLPLWFGSIEWWVIAVSGEDTVACNMPYRITIFPNALDPDRKGIPVEFGLHSIYPSPFNSVTTIRFGADKAVRTSVRIFDLLGREIATLFDRTPEIGNYKIAWNATNMPTGIYIVRLESAGRTAVLKVALIR